MKSRLFLIIACITVSCDNIFLGGQDQIISLEENLLTPAATNDGWEVSSLVQQNIHAPKIEQLIRTIQNDPKNLHSFLIAKNNKLVVDAYFDGWHRERLHDLRSSSKSVNSTLIGIAIDKNFIPDVHQRVFDFFPEYADLNNDKKNEIRIEHLLTMTAGLDWNQNSYPNEDTRNDEGMMERSNDWLRYALSKEMVYTPGQNFVYNSGCSNLLAGIIKKSTGDHANVFAEKYLFQPLNISHYFWRRQSDGLCNAGAGLALRPRDIAKLGQLFLDSGRWKGNQIVSATWVNSATATFSGSEANQTGYGYQWWTAKYTINNKVIRIFSARGNGGQYIFVVPSLNAVVVFTGGNYSPLNQNQPFGLMVNIILPAML